MRRLFKSAPVKGFQLKRAVFDIEVLSQTRAQTDGQQRHSAAGEQSGNNLYDHHGAGDHKHRPKAARVQPRAAIWLPGITRNHHDS